MYMLMQPYRHKNRLAKMSSHVLLLVITLVVITYWKFNYLRIMTQSIFVISLMIRLQKWPYYPLLKLTFSKIC